MNLNNLVFIHLNSFGTPQIIVQRGKDKVYVIVPLNDADRLSVNDQLIQTVQEAEAEYVKQKTIRIKDPGNIWEQSSTVCP